MKTGKLFAVVKLCFLEKIELFQERNMGYIEDLRKVVGNQPLILVGGCSSCNK